MPTTLESYKSGEKREIVKELFTKTGSVTDSYGSRLKLVKAEIGKNKPIDKNLIDKIPEGLEVIYSINGDKPKLVVKWNKSVISGKGLLFSIVSKEEEIKEEGVRNNLKSENEGINYSNIVSALLETGEKKFSIIGKFKDETGNWGSGFSQDTVHTRTGLGQITISEIVEQDSVTSPLAE